MSYATIYRPFNLLNEFNKFLEQSSASDTSNIDTSQWVPAVDIKEDSNQFVIFADLPGLERENIQVAMENNILTIKGERTEESKDLQKNYSRIERVRGSFYRRFTLPDTADGSKIYAKMKNGVLEVVIPKKEIVQPRLIEVQIEE